ncbi:MAG: Mor transcription activator family protein [Leptolyngbyaceae cyanobacterium]
MAGTETLDQFTEMLGVDVAQKIITQFGGQRITVPVQTNFLHPLCQAIGVEAFGQFTYYFGGERLHIPTDRIAKIPLRNARICAEHTKGDSINVLVQRHNLSYRRIQQILQLGRKAAPSDQTAAA